MNFVSVWLEEFIDKLGKSKSYLVKKSGTEINYNELIELLDLKINSLNKNRQPVIKLVSTDRDLVLKLKAKSESNLELRSLYSFEAIFSFKNLPKIINNSELVFLVFKAKRTITAHQFKLIDLAKKRKVDLFILLEQTNQKNSPKTLDEYVKSQARTDIAKYLFVKDTFFDWHNDYHLKLYEQFLIDKSIQLKKTLVLNHHRESIDLVEDFFKRQSTINWHKTKQIKSKYLQGKEVNNYQQVLTKTFNKISQLRQQKALLIKQKLNQSRSHYTNPFISDSWVFELQQIIERSQIKLVKEENEIYLYLLVENDELSEYIHSYILNIFQERVTETLKSQWSSINYTHAEGGLEAFVMEANHKIASIALLEPLELERKKIVFEPEPTPELDISGIVDFQCFKANSRLVFDYSYTQSSWFKILTLGSIGMAIYLFTKFYFGTGRYIGFVILIFQIINIFTGQSIKKTKLKIHKKELQRIINNKSQILLRLIVEQMIQTSIAKLEQKNTLYQAQIDAISDLAYQKLETIKQDLNKHQSIKNKLERDQDKIMSWLK